ncbi:MAG: type IV pilus assembly protein PilM [Candidatus Omnitrophota bacterium]|jgi:type IV pilus assembly protein PilM|nr:MAG: type IV pilus assembly protein PilM [Candidatus Omnitrophota bacterium]
MESIDFLKDFFVTPSIGLDIGSFSVKLALIRKTTLKKETFLSVAIAPIKNAPSREGIIEAIKEVFSQVKTDCRKINLSVCGPNVVMRYIILPHMKEKDLFKSLEFELEKYIPYKKEEVMTDYRILAKLANNKILVLLVAVERGFIQERVDLVKELGFEPQLINVDSLALVEAFKATNPSFKGVAAILDIGYKISKLVVLDNDVPYFSRDIETGEYEIAQTISEKFGIPFEKARALAYEPQEKREQVAEAVNLVLSNILEEINLSFEYCERNLEKKVEYMFLSGGGCRISVLFDSFKHMPGLRLEFLDPTRGFKLVPPLTEESIKAHAPLLGVAIGLALS